MPEPVPESVQEDPRVVRSKQAVIHAARELLLELGFAGVTIEAVAARSGVAKTTIYRHWADRNVLIMDVFPRVDCDENAPATEDLRADIIAKLRGLTEGLVSEEWGEVMPALIEAAEREPEFRALSKAYINTKRRPTRKRLELAVRRGELPADTNIEVLMAGLAGPLFYRRYISRQSLSDRHLVEKVTDQALRGAGWVQPPLIL